MEKKIHKILFVDDEPAVLRSLKRQFMDAPFEAFYALDADSALQIIRNENIDLIVTDVKMPGMDGVELLEKVKKEFPDVGRIVLSGYVETELVTRGLLTGAILEYISKPWNDEQLLNSILHFLQIQERLQKNSLLQTINKIKKLPVLPEVYQEFLRGIREEKPIKELAEIIEKDAIISAELLRIANSAFYSAGRETPSVQQAMIRLGLNLVKEIILTVGLQKNMNLTTQQKKWLEEVNSHSAKTNLIFQRLYQEIYGERINSSLGLLHDIGQIIMAIYFPENYQQIKNYMIENNQDDFLIAERETQSIDVSHTELGAYFLSWWNLPFNLVEAALYHHQKDIKNLNHSKDITILYIADQIAKKREFLLSDDFQTMASAIYSGDIHNLITSIEDII